MIVGFTLGLVGGSDSILAMPLLPYLVRMHLAIVTSAVAVNAFANVVPHHIKTHTEWRSR